MLRTIIILVMSLVSINSFSQGFEKKSKTEKIGNYELGNYYLYKHQSDELIVYSFTMRDKEYNSKNFLQVRIGTKDEASTFLKKVVETIDSMEEGDRFELGLPDGNTGFYAKVITNKVLGITVGDLGEYGYLPKSIAKSMLKRIEKE